MEGPKDWYGLYAVTIQAFAAASWPIAVAICFYWMKDHIAKLLPLLRVRQGDTEVSFPPQQLIEVAQVTFAKTAQEGQRVSDMVAPSLATSHLGSLTDDELRAKVDDVAKKMRTLHSQFRTEQDAEFRHRDPNWDNQTRRYLEGSANRARRWQTELQPEAAALRNELRRRLNKTDSGHSDHSYTVFELGMLAGVNPLIEAALALEALASELPNASPRPGPSLVS